MKRIFSTAVLLAASTLFVASCKKDSKSTSGSGTHKVQYKADVSANANINTVSFTNDQSEVEIKTGLAMQSWQSAEMTVPASVKAVNFLVNGQTKDLKDNGNITIQILVDGKVVKENTGSGNVLSATATYMF